MADPGFEKSDATRAGAGRIADNARTVIRTPGNRASMASTTRLTGRGLGLPDKSPHLVDAGLGIERGLDDGSAVAVAALLASN
jgi:hypothetical protein